MKDNIKIILSPLAGVTDRAFRYVCSLYDLDYSYTEMVSAKGLKYLDKKTEELMARYPGEDKLGIQIFGSDPEIMAGVVRDHILGRGFESIDINMGCPAPKIVKNGEGAALMKDPERVKQIVYKTVEASDLPVSVKFRMGFDSESINYLEIGKICQEYGASKVTIHARTREQMYSGKADWDAIKQLKRELKIPVTGNGDIFTPEDAKAMVDYTGVDSIAVARGAMGNPFIFKQIKDYLSKGSYTKVGLSEIIDTIYLHYEKAIEFKGERIAVNEMRKHIGWYLKGFKNSAKLRDEINKLKTKDEVFSVLREYRKQID